MQEHKHIQIPVKVVNGAKWGDLSTFAMAHEICCESGKLKNENFSFSGGHRVRLYQFKKNVHWRIPDGAELDISNVVPDNARRRNQRR